MRHSPILKQDTVENILAEAQEATGDECPLFHEKPVGQQAAFYQSKARVRLCLGGNRAGKTSAGAREASFWISGLHPFHEVPEVTKGWAICETRELANEVLIPKLLYYLPLEGPGALTHYDPGTDSRPASITTANGSRCIFRTFGQRRQRFQSDAVHWIWVDEEMPGDIYRECLMRLVDHNGRIWLTMTPLEGRTWVYEDIFVPWDTLEVGPEEIEVFQWSIWDNTSLPRDAIESVIENVKDEAERESREHGSFTDRTGLIYRDFKPANHIIEPFDVPSHWPVVLAMDPAFNHPFAASLQVEAPWGDRIVVGEVWVKETGMGRLAYRTYQMVNEALPYCIKHRKLERLMQEGGHLLGTSKIEPTFQNLVAVRDPAAASYGHELVQYGIPTRLANRDVDTGIVKVRTLLQNANEGVCPGLYLFRGRAPRHVQEFRTYVWKEREGEKAKPMKKGDDCMDAARYGVMQPLSALSSSGKLTSREKSPIVRYRDQGAVSWAPRQFTGRVQRGIPTEFEVEDIGEWLVQSERRIRAMPRSTKRRYSDEQIMNYLEESQRLRMKPAW